MENSSVKRMTRLCISFVFIVLIGVATLGASGNDRAFGFTPDDSLNSNTPDDPTDDVQSVSRWNNIPGSLVDNGVRGLGGGIEYSVSPDFCATLIPQFIDEPKPACDDLRVSIRRAFDRWSQGHPVLRFTDVSDRIQPELPPTGERVPWNGFGAEIDFLALTGEQFPPVRPFAAYSTTWYRFEDPVATNGQTLKGSTTTSVDVVFKSTACFYAANGLSSGCNHFESLVLHEIGHALSLDHPNEFPRRNFDTDDDPANRTEIACADPGQGLRLSPNIDTQAVMNSSMGRALQVRLELTPDDIAGRDFFYPICPVAQTGPQGGAPSLWRNQPPAAGGGGGAACPESGRWLLLYWGSDRASIEHAAASCLTTDRLWVNRTGRWMGFSRKTPDSSDWWDVRAGEAHFVHGG
jgi:hypothetical protein